jgi:hypothetical protein
MKAHYLKYYLSGPRINIYLAKANNDFDKAYRLYKLNIELSEAIQKLTKQHKVITADRIIAELNFGFWNRIFNRHYASLLWKPLRLMFQNTPKHLRKRDTISEALYRIRKLRNRIYHYEPIFANLEEIENQYKEMITFLSWLDKNLPQLLSDIDRFNDVLKKAKEI